MSRPKRESAQRAASQTSALFWNEERDLKKALHASLVEARRKARIADRERDKIKEKEKCSEKQLNHNSPNKSKNKSTKIKKSDSNVTAATQVSSTIIPKEKASGCAREETDNGNSCFKKTRIPTQRKSNVLLWNEEQELKKALQASLVEARRKAKSVDKEKVKIKEKEKCSEKQINHSTIILPNKSRNKSSKLKKSELAITSDAQMSTMISKEKAPVCVLENSDNGSNCLKKPRIPAQRKFAQVSSNNTPISSPVKMSYCVPTVTDEIFKKVKPTAADFLTFLCFRDTSLLPDRLDLETLNKEVDSEPQIESIEGEEIIVNSNITDVKPFISDDKKSHIDKKSQESPTHEKSENNLMNKIAALKVKYKLQRLAKKSTNVTSSAKNEILSVSVSKLRKDENFKKKQENSETNKNSKLDIVPKTSDNKVEISTNSTRVLRSHRSPSAEGSIKSPIPSMNSLCKSSSRQVSKSTPKKLRSSSPVVSCRPQHRKVKPKGVQDYPEKRMTRSLSNRSKKDEEAVKERAKEIKRKILEVEKRQKHKLKRHASESSLHSSSSSDSLPSSVSSSSSINIARITRSLEQLKKLRKELKKNKQNILNGS